MTTLDEKRAEWLYAHFQAITKSSDRLFAAFGVLTLCTLAVWVSTDKTIELVFLKVQVDRQVLLGGLLVGGAFAFIAFCGNYDQGEVAMEELATALGCQYEDLWLIDTHPTFVDYAKYRRSDAAKRRRFLGRMSAALIYPLIISPALFFLSFVWGFEVFRDSMAWLDTATFGVAAITLVIAWIRAYEYIGRRVKTWWHEERKRRAQAAV